MGFTSQVVPRGVFFQSLFRSSYTYPVGKDLLISTTFNFINPRHHMVNTDRVSQVIPTKSVAGLSDEEILALFTTGFFGGFIFRIESWVLRICGSRFLPAKYTGGSLFSLLKELLFELNLQKFSGFRADAQAVAVRRPTAIPRQRLLPVGSLFFSSFLMLDKHIAEPAKEPPSADETDNSYVDYGFGSDEARFAGCHRFRVTRLPAATETSDAQVQIDLEHFRCNPQQNIPSLAESFQWFHFAYAKALFANGIQAILKRSSSLHQAYTPRICIHFSLASALDHSLLRYPNSHRMYYYY